METDILIIGGGPAGMVVAMSSRVYYPNKKVVVVKDTDESVVPCGIPYIFGDKLNGINDDLVPCGDMAKAKGIELIHDKAIKIKQDKKEVKFISNNTIKYDKLVIATGSVPKKLSCETANNLYYISKNPNELRKVYDGVKDVKNIVIIGTGFIGIELAFELYKKGKNVSIVGNKLLGNAFDDEFVELIEKIILDNDEITHYKGHLKDFVIHNGNISKILTDNGDTIECDAVIGAIGYKPNSELAKNSNLPLTRDFIYVDEYLRTPVKDIFAVGDCVVKRDFITKKTLPIMLASTATAEARTVASSLYGINYTKTFSGTISIFSTVISNTCFASAGLTEDKAKKENIYVESLTVTVDDKHPKKLPNSRKQTIKLICMKKSGVVVGAQMIGGLDIGEMINVIGLAIENKLTIYSLLNLQVATHPLLTSAPTSYPIAQAAQMLDIKLNPN